MAESPAEIAASQRLRYQVFYEEMAAAPTLEMTRTAREFDSYDDYCDHLLVFDANQGAGPERVVGTYRLMRLGTFPMWSSYTNAPPRSIRAFRSLPSIGP